MTSIKHAISEHDVVTLRERVGSWPAGTTGAVVSVYADALLVEVAGAHGETLDMITVRPQLLDVSMAL